MSTVPILNAFFTSTGMCMHINEGTLDLPMSMEAMQKQLKAQGKSLVSAELCWKKYLLQHDLTQNMQFEQPRVLKDPAQLNNVSCDCWEPGSFDRIVRIVQFFRKSTKEFLDNQALVSYYYNNVKLCSFQVCISLKLSISELALYEHYIRSTMDEHRALMGWYLSGNSLLKNPFGYAKKGQQICYIKAYRRAIREFPQQMAQKGKVLCGNCFAYEHEDEICDDIIDGLCDEAFYDYMMDVVYERWCNVAWRYQGLYREELREEIEDEVYEETYNKAYGFNVLWQTDLYDMN